MKNVKWVILGVLVLAMALSASAQERPREPNVPLATISIGVEFDTSIHPLGSKFHIGDWINYQALISNPSPSGDFCDAEITGVWEVWGGTGPTDITNPFEGEQIPPNTLPYVLGQTGTPTNVREYLYARQATADRVFNSGGFDWVRTDVFGEGDMLGQCVPDGASGTGQKSAQILMPCVRVTKIVDCDESKVGDEVIYTICVTNCGNAGADLTLISVIDDVLGDLTGLFNPTLAVGETECVNIPYTVQAGDPNPLVNTVTVTYEDEIGGPEGTVTATDDATVDLVTPGMEVHKVCLTPNVPEGEDATFEITIENTGDVALNYTTDDPAVGPGDVNPGETDTYSVTEPWAAGERICNQITVTWTIGGGNRCNLANTDDVVSELACCETTTDGDGCTPGYWKNHTECWCDRFATTDLLGDVFTIPTELSYHSGHTLLDALNYSGGRLKGTSPNSATAFERCAGRLLFHGVAALLNGCHNDVAFGMSADGVIAAVNAALATLECGEFDILHTRLADMNERGCPIDAHCRVHDEDPAGDGERVGLPDGPVKGSGEVTSDSDEPGVASSIAIPKSLVVRPAVPNPFTHTVRLSYGLPVSARVRVDIFDVAGRRLATLVDKDQPAGFHSVKWDGKDANGSRVAPGIYFSRVSCSGQTAVAKMIVME